MDLRIEKEERREKGVEYWEQRYLDLKCEEMREFVLWSVNKKGSGDWKQKKVPEKEGLLPF